MKPLRNSIHKFLKSAEVTFFEGLYRDYFTRTLFFAQQYLPDPEEAREIAQETFVTLWEKRTEIRPDLSVQAFILTIAKHKCLNVLRKKIAEQKYKGRDDAAMRQLFELSDRNPTEEQRISGKDET